MTENDMRCSRINRYLLRKKNILSHAQQMRFLFFFRVFLKHFGIGPSFMYGSHSPPPGPLEDNRCRIIMNITLIYFITERYRNN